MKALPNSDWDDPAIDELLAAADSSGDGELQVEDEVFCGAREGWEFYEIRESVNQRGRWCDAYRAAWMVRLRLIFLFFYR